MEDRSEESSSESGQNSYLEDSFVTNDSGEESAEESSFSVGRKRVKKEPLTFKDA